MIDDLVNDMHMRTMNMILLYSCFQLPRKNKVTEAPPLNLQVVEAQNPYYVVKGELILSGHHFYIIFE